MILAHSHYGGVLVAIVESIASGVKLEFVRPVG